MGIDQRLWSWAGIGSGLDISAADGNLKGALYLYKIYKGIPWTGNIWLITQRSRVVTVPASGWSERIPVGKTPLRIRPSEDMAVEDDHGKEYRVTLNEPDWNFPHYTEWVKYRSLTGKPAVVLVSP